MKFTLKHALAAAILLLSLAAPVAEGQVEDYGKRADQGDSAAQRALGALYMNGEGVSRDYANGLKWISRAAAQGYSTAQLDLGTIYQNGLGVPQDYVIAHMWFNLASAAGS
jgi:TPR repeat protein